MAGYSSRVTLTRTADTNAYAANDVLGAATGSTAALTFTDLGQDVLDAMAGIPIWTGVNITDFLAWADANLAGEGLMRIPSNPDP